MASSWEPRVRLKRPSPPSVSTGQSPARAVSPSLRSAYHMPAVSAVPSSEALRTKASPSASVRLLRACG